MSLGKYLIGVPRGGFKSEMKRACGVTGDTGGADAGAGAGAGAECRWISHLQPTFNPSFKHLKIDCNILHTGIEIIIIQLLSY